MCHVPGPSGLLPRYICVTRMAIWLKSRTPLDAAFWLWLNRVRMTRGQRQKGFLSMKAYAKYLEWFGVATAILYSLLVASNTGSEFLGFTLLLISAIAIGLWAWSGQHRGILLLQFFYAGCRAYRYVQMVLITSQMLAQL